MNEPEEHLHGAAFDDRLRMLRMLAHERSGFVRRQVPLLGGAQYETGGACWRNESGSATFLITRALTASGVTRPIKEFNSLEIHEDYDKGTLITSYHFALSQNPRYGKDSGDGAEQDRPKNINVHHTMKLADGHRGPGFSMEAFFARISERRRKITVATLAQRIALVTELERGASGMHRADGFLS